MIKFALIERLARIAYAIWPSEWASLIICQARWNMRHKLIREG